MVKTAVGANSHATAAHFPPQPVQRSSRDSRACRRDDHAADRDRHPQLTEQRQDTVAKPGKNAIKVPLGSAK